MNKAIREWFDWRGCVVTGAAVVIVLGLMAILWSPFRVFIASEVTAAWASAIATFLAAGIALWIAFWRHDSETNHERLEAAFTLATLSNRLGNLGNDVAQLLPVMGEDNPPAPDRTERVIGIRQQLEELPWSKVRVFDKNAALEIVHAIDQLHGAEMLCNLHDDSLENNINRIFFEVHRYLLNAATAAVKAEEFLREAR